jgi:small subunit ribosomal protein S8
MDTIGEFLTRVRNAGLARHEKVDVPSSKVRVGIAGVLKAGGYIRDFKVVKDVACMYHARRFQKFVRVSVSRY